MNDAQLANTLLLLSAIFVSTLLLGLLFLRMRIPLILSALFVGVAMHYLPLPVLQLLHTPEYGMIFSFLSDLGVLFLLFYIGLQIDPKRMRHLGGDIVTLTLLNTLIPFLLGVAVMRFFDYGWLIAFVIGAGVLDDVIEVFLVAFVSLWIGIRAGEASGGNELVKIAATP